MATSKGRLEDAGLDKISADFTRNLQVVADGGTRIDVSLSSMDNPSYPNLASSATGPSISPSTWTTKSTIGVH
uniref:Flagellar hook capping protein n=1 Tax=Panagrellus redivivus TaxID=6233 RepID=A0A7E5A095_PANRE